MQAAFDGLPQADYILMTDIHGDHRAPTIADKLKQSGTEIPGARPFHSGTRRRIQFLQPCQICREQMRVNDVQRPEPTMHENLLTHVLIEWR